MNASVIPTKKFFISFLILLFLSSHIFSQTEQVGIKKQTDPGIIRTTKEIMLKSSIMNSNDIIQLRNNFELQEPERDNLIQPPDAVETSQWPLGSSQKIRRIISSSTYAQSVDINFNAVTGPNETGAFPPDTDGAVGPSQFLVFLNGRLRTFAKNTGLADGVLDVTSDVFFSSVMTPGTNFSTDPNVRFDRLTNRWFLNMIDVPNGTGATPNRIMIAVSDGGEITASTVWTFYQFVGDTNLFTDYQSLGIDAEAIYIGANMFTLTGSFNSTKGFVIPKSPLITAGPLTVWQFSNLGSSSSAGPFAPRGVDNFDPNNTGSTAVGYFIGVDVLSFSTLSIRRITDPGNTSTSPTLSSNIMLTVPTTTYPSPVTHLGNTRGNNGRLDALDDRLFAAHLRNGRLWTAHNFRVSAAGNANTSTSARNACRWYEINMPNTGNPSLIQAGTIFDSTANLVDAHQYWIPSVMVSGQGHAAIGFNSAGTPFYASAAVTGRLKDDPLGTMQSINTYAISTTAYNPTGDPGGAGGRRWGDYSFTSLDPNDDMTIWTIQEYCNATNTYGVRVAKLNAPPPATPISASPNTVYSGQPSIDINITGSEISGSGFYDPGDNLIGGTPFNHISAEITGGVTVNSVTYIDPTHISINISTVGASSGLTNLSISNPDGQLINASLLSVETRISADIKLFLEGPYDIALNEMHNTINGNIPTTSPYFEDPITITGDIPSPDIIDWILVELRTGTDSSTSVIKKSAFLTKDGNLVDTDGSTPLYFNGIPAGSYYVVIHHRNHLDIMSKTALTFSEI